MGEVQRQALARDLSRHLACLGLDELRLVDFVVARLRLGRERYGELDLSAPRDWAKELGEELVDALVYHAARELAAQDLARAGLREAARQEMFAIGMKVVDDHGEEIDPREAAAVFRADEDVEIAVDDPGGEA